MRLPTGVPGIRTNTAAPPPTTQAGQGGHQASWNKDSTNVAPAGESSSGKHGSVQDGSSTADVFASATAKHISILKKKAAGRHLESKDSSTHQIFSDDAQEKLKSANKVVVAGFSSQGGGHTERMFRPLADSNVGQGNVIVLVLPPHWIEDSGNEAKRLGDYKGIYERDGINVVTVQADKTVLGFYYPDGPSDNFGILQEFASKPKRDNSQVPQFGPPPGTEVQLVQGFTHHAIMQQIVDIVDDPDKITVFEDMDPYLAKAAAYAGVPESHIVGQSNHLLLLDAESEGYFEGRSDAFLVKANGNGYIGNVATVQFDAEVNTTGLLGKSLDTLGIQPDHQALDVRKNMVQMLLDGGRKHDLASTGVVPMSGCVMVSPEATAEDIDRGAYIYLNKYTDPLAQHIRKRLNGEGTPEQVAAYRKSIFVICGTQTFDESTGIKGNAMHVGQAANFDAVTAAGFGTSSEMHYLIMNDAYRGNLLLMPVEKQHEQQANAEFLLPAALGDLADQVESATDIDDLLRKFDDMIVNKATTNAKLENETMESLYTATHATGPQATDKAVERLNTKGGMTADEARLLDENTTRAFDPARTALRRLNKVMIPALTALSEGKIIMDIRVTAKDESKIATVQELIRTLSYPDRAADLMQADFSSDVAQSQLEKSVEILNGLMKLPSGPARQQAAQDLMRGTYADDTYILGY